MNSSQSYALALNVLLQVLASSSHQSYLLRANVPSSRLPASLKRGTFRAEVLVVAGVVKHCLVLDQDNRICLEGANACEALSSQEQLIWHVEPCPLLEQHQPSLFPLVASSWAEPFVQLPAQMAPLLPWIGRGAPVKLQHTPEVMTQLDRRQRMIWLLIDGSRTVNELAVLLQVSPEAVSETLTLLEGRGLITFSPPKLERR